MAEPSSIDDAQLVTDEHIATPVQPISDNENDQAKDEGDEVDEDDGDEDDEESDDEPVETLVSGRSRRQTAGNRMSTLIDQEADDDLTLLFAEDGDEDNEFEDPDAVEPSDVDDDSSSDDEDQGPTAGEEELEGEQQLQKEERAAKRAQKRKADKAFTLPAKVRKRVKIDDSSTQPGTPSSVDAAPKHRKKSERVSWIPTDQDAPVRTSSRTLSVQNKERTIASMKESEGRRAQQIKAMEETHKRKAAERARPMTQQERLAEAAKVERQNSKSLNKWEETEKERLKKQKERLEALQHRKLEGPVIRWHSTPVDWVGGKMIPVIKRVKVEEIVVPHEGHQPSEEETEKMVPEPEPAQSDRTLMAEAEASNTIDDPPSAPEAALQDDAAAPHGETGEQDVIEQIDEAGMTDLHTSDHQPVIAVQQEHEEQDVQDADLEISEAERPATGNADDDQATQGPTSSSFLDGIGYYASLPETQQDSSTSSANAQQNTNTVTVDAQQDIIIPVAEVEEETKAPVEDTPKDTSTPTADADTEMIEMETSVATPNATESQTVKADCSTATLAAADNETLNQEDSQAVTQDKNDIVAPVQLQTPIAVAAQAPPLPDERAAHNTVSLLNLAPNASSNRDKDIPRRILFSWRTSDCVAHNAANSTKSVKASQLPQQQLCAITSVPAKYRDPLTGLPYSNADAFTTIRRLVNGGCRWSSLLGGWVGLDVGEGSGYGLVARGVPEGFVKPKKEQPKDAASGAVEINTEPDVQGGEKMSTSLTATGKATPAKKSGKEDVKQESVNVDEPRRTRGRAASRATAK